MKKNKNIKNMKKTGPKTCKKHENMGPETMVTGSCANLFWLKMIKNDKKLWKKCKKHEKW